MTHEPLVSLRWQQQSVRQLTGDSLGVSFQYTPGRGGTPYRGDVSNCDKFAVSSCIELISTQIIFSLHACSN